MVYGPVNVYSVGFRRGASVSGGFGNDGGKSVPRFVRRRRHMTAVAEIVSGSPRPALARRRSALESRERRSRTDADCGRTDGRPRTCSHAFRRSRVRASTPEKRETHETESAFDRRQVPRGPSGARFPPGPYRASGEKIRESNAVPGNGRSPRVTRPTPRGAEAGRPVGGANRVRVVEGPRRAAPARHGG